RHPVRKIKSDLSTYCEFSRPDFLVALLHLFQLCTINMPEKSAAHKGIRKIMPLHPWRETCQPPALYLFLFHPMITPAFSIIHSSLYDTEVMCKFDESGQSVQKTERHFRKFRKNKT